MEQTLKLHLPYHPKDCTRNIIREDFEQCIVKPPQSLTNIASLLNHKNKKFARNRLLIVYHRAKNLNSILSPRKLYDIGSNDVETTINNIKNMP